MQRAGRASLARRAGARSLASSIAICWSIGDKGLIPDYSYEKVFSRFENWYPRVMKAVRSGNSLDDEQLATLACLAALQDARVRRMDFVEPMTKVREITRDLYKRNRPELSDAEIEAATDAVVRRELFDDDSHRLRTSL